MSTSTKTRFRPGVLYGDEVTELLNYASENEFALPAVNVVGTNSINAVMETARDMQSPVMIQLSNGGASFYAGKGLSNEAQQAAILGSISAAMHVHTLSQAYGVTVIMHTDHCARKLLPWIDGLLEAGEKFYEKRGYPLFSSHMLDLSEEPLEENVATCVEYLKRMDAIGMTLEIELGVTGGEEDGVDNTGIDSSRLYTQPEEVAYAYEKLSEVSHRFTIAAAFGNVHGVYAVLQQVPCRENELVHTGNVGVRIVECALQQVSEIPGVQDGVLRNLVYLLSVAQYVGQSPEPHTEVSVKGEELSHALGYVPVQKIPLAVVIYLGNRQVVL